MASRVIKRILDRADGLFMGESRGGDPLVSIEWPMPGSSLPGVAQACVLYGELMDAGGGRKDRPFNVGLTSCQLSKAPGPGFLCGCRHAPVAGGKAWHKYVTLSPDCLDTRGAGITLVQLAA